MKKFSSHTKKKYADVIANQFKVKGYKTKITKTKGKYPYNVWIKK